ncbi:MAG: histidine kinase N-terminal domain-containing protein [Euzebyales bacterium]|nr:histidine kinase N-terminal domain-containing protein [Euzebyales bacterium]MDQ3432992.1 PAS domain-containing sensor histidine kinase [Actinomycetota bacterium]
MSVLEERLLDRAGLQPDTVDHLQLLLADWQILADLSFADLLLFVPHRLGDGTPAYLCVGQMRPYTAQTIYHEDLVGQAFPITDRPMVGRALAEQRVIRDADPDWSTGVPVREEAIPVRFRGEVVAVVTREANVSTARSPSQLELTYLQSAGELAQMLADGTFPYAGHPPEERELSPRVGDGIMRVDARGTATYASPNAISAYRRLGSLESLIGQHLRDFDVGSDELVRALAGGEPVETEVERQGAVIVRRLLPLIGHDDVIGGLVLVREVTELRRHERALRLKDATIREIHHRVKNNLQTVASLLRLQGRRLRTDEARAALAESVRRISSIALVHETLSQESRQRVNFAKIARRIVDMLADGLTDPDVPLTFEMDGEPGELPAEVATPLALVMTELLQNCVEHAFPSVGEGLAATGGTVRLGFVREPGTLTVVVADDGVGLPEGTTLDMVANLGLQIARTLVESELGGTFASRSGREGTTVELSLPLS